MSRSSTPPPQSHENPIPHAASRQAFREALYNRFRGAPLPLLMDAAGAFGIPGASLWSGARLWVNRYRELGLNTPGDRILIDAGRTPAHVMATLAAWWQGLTPCFPTPSNHTATAMALFDARAAVTPGDLPHAIRIHPSATPLDAGHVSLRQAAAPSPQTAALFQHTNAPDLLPVPYDVLLKTLLNTPTPSEGSVIRTTLSWNTPSGALEELWPALLNGAIIFVDPPVTTDTLLPSSENSAAIKNSSHLPPTSGNTSKPVATSREPHPGPSLGHRIGSECSTAFRSSGSGGPSICNQPDF